MMVLWGRGFEDGFNFGILFVIVECNWVLFILLEFICNFIEFMLLLWLGC